MRIRIMILLVPMSVGLAFGQWQIQRNDIRAEFRGLSAVSEKIAWAGGSRNTWARTLDGGATWEVGSITDTETLDFRDVEGIDADTAYLLSIGTGSKSRIYKTTNGGKDWTAQVVNPHPKAFLDGLAFWDASTGIAVGDPIDGRFFLLRTTDGGAHWTRVPEANIPPALPGDGIFAASGTTILTEGKNNAWFATGGAARARVFRSTNKGLTWSAADTPLISTQASTGIFSIAFKDPLHGIIVGGDYRKVEEAVDNIAVTADGGLTWSLVRDSGLGGFRSCVTYLPGTRGRTLLATGPAGTDYSLDGGMHWTRYDTQGFHVFSFTRSKAVGWAAGTGGRIAKYMPLQPPSR
jgi:photosystem II stability/assembly factor-like uncharacterized protein